MASKKIPELTKAELDLLLRVVNSWDFSDDKKPAWKRLYSAQRKLQAMFDRAASRKNKLPPRR
jgi:hypothetical protein